MNSSNFLFHFLQTHIDINRLKQGNSGVAHKLTDISQRLNQSTAETKRYKSLLEGEQETNKVSLFPFSKKHRSSLVQTLLKCFNFSWNSIFEETII